MKLLFYCYCTVNVKHLKVLKDPYRTDLSQLETLDQNESTAYKKVFNIPTNICQKLPIDIDAFALIMISITDTLKSAEIKKKYNLAQSGGCVNNHPKEYYLGVRVRDERSTDKMSLIEISDPDAGVYLN